MNNNIKAIIINIILKIFKREVMFSVLLNLKENKGIFATKSRDKTMVALINNSLLKDNE